MFYGEVRSPAVHTGAVDQTSTHKVKHEKEKKNAHALLALAQAQCQAVISKFVNVGALPDWAATFPSMKALSLTTDLKLRT
jgi:hypothetical protein